MNPSVSGREKEGALAIEALDRFGMEARKQRRCRDCEARLDLLRSLVAERDQLLELVRATRTAVDNWAASRDEIVDVLDSALAKFESPNPSTGDPE